MHTVVCVGVCVCVCGVVCAFDVYKTGLLCSLLISMTSDSLSLSRHSSSLVFLLLFFYLTRYYNVERLLLIDSQV
jgi:hypothetical protein